MSTAGLRICDVCGEEMEWYEIGHRYFGWLYCENCWEIHQKNEAEGLTAERFEEF